MINELTDILRKQRNAINMYFDTLAAHNSDVFNSVITMTKLIRSANESNACVYFTGVGKNQTLAIKTANMFRSVGCMSHFLDPIDALHGDMGTLRDNDVVIGLSRSGQTSELVAFLRYLTEVYNKQIRAIVICENSKVDKLKNVDYITLPRVDELDDWNLIPTTSNIVMQMYMDAIAVLYVHSKKLTKDEFVLSHPGGYIGSQK